jgi:Tol biopolymer transport system component/imidazolonepropionase-like amidohydrolase
MRTHRPVRTVAIVIAMLALPPLALRAQAPAAATIRLTLNEGTSMAAALSPDGRTIATDLLGALWVMPAAGGTAKRITEETMDVRMPAWSPDGARIAFQAYRSSTWQIWNVNADGSDLRAVTNGPFDDREPHWSPDGTRIAFSSDRGGAHTDAPGERDGNYDVWVLTLSTGDVTRVTRGPANEFMPAWSPDGREIAFVSDRREKPGVYAIAVGPNGGGAERLVAGTDGAVAGPSWSPDGSSLAFNVIAGGRSRLVVASGGALRDIGDADEDVFPFRPQWIGVSQLLYTADGKVKTRPAAGGPARTIEFSADISFPRSTFTPKHRASPALGPHPVRGIVHPALSPDGKQVAFAALGDLWLMTIGSEPKRLTHDPYADTDPAWSSDGASLAFSTDRDGRMHIWVRDMRTGVERRLTKLADTEMEAAWSPDARRVAFVDEEGKVQVADVKTGDVQKVHDHLFNPGRPSWSPDGQALVVSALRPYSTRFREGTNEVLRIALDGRPDEWFDPLPHKSIGMREDFGPAWSPDGTQMAAVIDGRLAAWPVARDGRPLAPPRQLSTGLANSPSWAGDSRHVLYQSDDGFELVDVVDGTTRDVRPNLKWTPGHPAYARSAAPGTVIHAGHLWDGRSATLRDNVDIVLDGNRIWSVEPHRAALHTGKVIDASNETIVPGLIEIHSHLEPEYGETLGRIWLSWGVTTVRNPASNPFEGQESREAIESGARVGPRVFTTGDPFDGTRVYYAGGAAIDGGAQLTLQLQRAAHLGYDLVKTYVRLPDLLQKRVIEEAHKMGMPVTSHEIWPAVALGADGVEHIRGTSRRGYSPKVTALNRTYGDIIALLGASKMTITPTINIQSGFQLQTLRDPSWLDDPRIQQLYPPAVLRAARALLAQPHSQADLDARERLIAPLEKTAFNVVKAGGRVVAGTDAPINPYGLSLLAELEHYVAGGLTPLEAMRTATSVSAEALGLAADLGSIEPGKLADFSFVDGNPLADIKALRRVKRVMKDGDLFELEALLKGPRRQTLPQP